MLNRKQPCSRSWKVFTWWFLSRYAGKATHAAHIGDESASLPASRWQLLQRNALPTKGRAYLSGARRTSRGSLARAPEGAGGIASFAGGWKVALRSGMAGSGACGGISVRAESGAPVRAMPATRTRARLGVLIGRLQQAGPRTTATRPRYRMG